jgi:lactate dehydrogenase-like 2-hydroxyacid dehydrogenase
MSPSEEGYLDVLSKSEAIIIGTGVVNAEFLDAAPKLGIAARFGVGYDNVDVEECSRRGVHVTHTPDVLSSAVADLTLGLILSLMRGWDSGLRADRSRGRPESTRLRHENHLQRCREETRR